MQATVHCADPDDTEVLVRFKVGSRYLEVFFELPDELASLDADREIHVHGHSPKTAGEFMALLREFFGVDPTSRDRRELPP